MGHHRSGFFSAEGANKAELSNSSDVQTNTSQQEEIHVLLNRYKDKIILMMRYHHIDSLDICFDHAGLYSNFGLADVNLFIIPQSDSSEANLNLFSESMYQLLGPHDIACFSYEELINIFSINCKELGLSVEASKSLYENILKETQSFPDLISARVALNKK